MVTRFDSDPVFRALADRTRREIVEVLGAGPKAVHDLAGRFEMSRPAVSKHLRILREAGLVSLEPSGKENLYRLEPGPMAEVIGWMNRHWSARLSGLKALAEAKQ